MSIDTGLALIIAFVINLMVVSCFAELFYNKGILLLYFFNCFKSFNS